MPMTLETDEPSSIFAVVCESGEYSDYMTWVAAAYISQEQAEKAAKEIQERDRAEYKAYHEFWKAVHRLHAKNKGRLPGKPEFYELDEAEQQKLYDAVGQVPEYERWCGRANARELPIGVEGRWLFCAAHYGNRPKAGQP